jgi:pyruvate formate lyase activating enzyme
MLRVNFGGIVPLSTIDWRGKAALVIFLRGCPLHCIYCHNYELLTDAHYVELRELESALAKNREFIDAVVLSGGEPFMQPLVVEAVARDAKRYGLLVGVHTNGYYPKAVETALEQRLIDKVSLDLKAPLADEQLYQQLTNVAGVAARVKETLEVALRAACNLEVVTTVFKALVGEAAVVRIARELEAAGAAHRPFIIQQGRVEHVQGLNLTEEAVYTRAELLELAAAAYRAAPLREVRIRTREEGEEVIYGGLK